MKRNLKTEATRLTLKGFKFMESTDGYHYRAVVFVDGIKVGAAEDLGMGGPVEFNPEVTPKAVKIIGEMGVTVDANNARCYKMDDIFETDCFCHNDPSCGVCGGTGKMMGDFELLIGTAAHNLICQKLEEKERKREETHTKRFIEKNVGRYRINGFKYYSLHYVGSKMVSMKPYHMAPKHTVELLKLQGSNPQITDIKIFAIQPEGV